MPRERRPLRVLTWPVHGSYLYYLSHADCEFYLPVERGADAGAAARADNLVPVPADEVQHLDLDCVLFQAQRNYLEDQHAILSPAQRRLPRIYLEHDPPREHPTDTRHPVDDPEILLVHVTPFNDLMWDSGRTPTTVIEHGVAPPPDVRHTGELPRGLVVVNHLRRRGRRLGADVFERVRSEVPLDLVGMGAEELGGLGEVKHDQLPAFASRYRFLFNPIRYTSLGLAVCEAMSIGMPVVGLATTGMVRAVEHGRSGYLDTDPDALVHAMKGLLERPEEARRLGDAARRRARERFGIERFARAWEATIERAVGAKAGTPARPPAEARHWGNA